MWMNGIHSERPKIAQNKFENGDDDRNSVAIESALGRNGAMKCMATEMDSID